MANQADTVVVDKLQKKAVAMDAAIPKGNTKRKEHEKLDKYQGLKEEVEKN